MQALGLASADGAASTFTTRWSHHLAWQRRQLRLSSTDDGRHREPPRFLVLRPGDKYTVCDAHGLQDLRQNCYKGAAPSGVHDPAAIHWDAFMLSSNRKRKRWGGQVRPLPGLGNVALSLVAAAVTAIVSRRVLLLENFSTPANSFGQPLQDLIVETSGWAPHLALAAHHGGATDMFAAHDDYDGFADLCRDNLRVTPASRVWRIFTNQYFLPLLLLNQHHAREVEAMAEALRRTDGGNGRLGGEMSLWTPAIRTLWVPRPALLVQLRAFLRETRLSDAPFVGMHARMPFHADKRQAIIECALARLHASNSSRLFLASMFGANRQILAASLRPSGYEVVTFGRAIGAQSESTAGSDAAVADMWLLGQATEVMINAGSTFGYVVQGLSGGRTTKYGGTHTSKAFVGNNQKECVDIGTTEASFHLLPNAIRAYSSCRSGDREAKRRRSLLYTKSLVKH